MPSKQQKALLSFRVPLRRGLIRPRYPQRLRDAISYFSMIRFDIDRGSAGQSIVPSGETSANFLTLRYRLLRFQPRFPQRGDRIRSRAVLHRDETVVVQFSQAAIDIRVVNLTRPWLMPSWNIRDVNQTYPLDVFF
jgi:hypothetical protein